jgi:hypothetical protein
VIMVFSLSCVVGIDLKLRTQTHDVQCQD